MAIFGNSGSGKSCSVSRIIQNIFLNPKILTYNANLFIFDAYGEYTQALSKIGEHNPLLRYHAYTTDVEDQSLDLLKIINVN